jgi:hypothetical protein
MENTLGLQVGNLVTIKSPEKIWLNDKVLRIGEIFTDSVSVKFNISDSISAIEWIEHVKPLSITPETLNLFEGFQKDFTGSIEQKFGDYFVTFRDSKCLIYFCGYVAAKVHYIHQLQNLIFSLTNGEYVLKLKN